MKYTARALAAVTVLAAAAVPARSSWGGSFSGPVGPQACPQYFAPAPAYAPAPAPAHVYQWLRWPDGDVRYWKLKDGGTTVGAWIVSDGLYRPMLPDGEYGAAAAPPCRPPDASPLPGDTLPTGVTDTGIPAKPLYSHKGRRVSKEALEELLGGLAQGSVPDDATKDTVAVVADAPLRKALLEALPEGLKAKCITVAYDPSDWHIQGYKWVAPCIVRQRADGRVVWHLRQASAENAHKIDPDYDPAGDPDPLSKLTLKPNILPPEVPGWVFAVGAALGGCFCFGFTAFMFVLAGILAFLVFRRRT